jgi:hypothetical protein
MPSYLVIPYTYGMFTNTQAAAYLAAMIDGEGWIGSPKNKQNRAIRISNTDPDLISAIREVCDRLGITYTVQHINARKEGWSAGWWVDITGRANMIRVRDEVPLRSSKKRARLDAIITSYVDRPPLDGGDLRRLYEEDGLTQREIATRLGVGFKRVLLAMRRHEITRRPHGPERALSVWRSRRAKYGQKGRA